jgi:hypothetical protein
VRHVRRARARSAALNVTLSERNQHEVWAELLARLRRLEVIGTILSVAVATNHYLPADQLMAVRDFVKAIELEGRPTT